MTDPTEKTAVQAAEDAVQQQKAEADKRFAELLQRDRQLQRDRAALKEREAAIRQAQDVLAKAKADPLSFLEEQGVSYDDWTNKVLKGKSGDPTGPLAARIAQLEQALAQQAHQSQASLIAQQRSQEAAYVRAFVDANATKYPLIQKTGSYDIVYQEIQNHLDRTGTLISEDEAAQQIEAKLLEVGKTLAQMEPVQAALVPPAPVSESPRSNAVSHPGTTLSNDMNSTVTSRVPTESMTVEDSLEAAAQLLRYVPVSEE